MITRTPLFRRTPSVARARGIATTLAVLLVAGCHDLPTAPTVVPGGPAAGHLAVYASAPSAVTTLVVEVTAPGIVKPTGAPDTLVFNITMSGGVGSGSVQVPAGPSRTFTVRAYEGVTETHRGASTVDIAQGNNPAISITLIPFVGTTPITVSIGTTLVIVTPAARTLEIGDTLRLTSQVIDQNGAYLGGGVVRWASLNPVRAQVDTLGLVTMRDTGDVQIVATYGTVGGSAKLTGANHISGVSYYLTWNGKSNQNWTDTTNWTPHGIAVARVPTGSDSVVIAASATRMPRLNACTAATARDLVVEAGATLDYGCSSTVGINVYRSAVIRGAITADVRAQRTASLSGPFAHLFVVGDSVKLADSTAATSVQLSGAGAQLLLSGRPLTVNGAVIASQGGRIALGGTTMTITGSLTLNDSSWVEMTNAADTLNVRGNLDFGTKDTRTGGLLSAGTLRVGGYLYANGRFSFAPSGTHQTIVDGTSYQYLQVDSAALDLGTWRNLTIRNPDRVVFSYYSTSNDSIALPNFQLDTTSGRVEFDYRRWGIMPAGGTLTITDTVYSYYGTVRVAGALTLRSRTAAPVGSPGVAKAMLTGPGTFAVAGVLSTDAASQVDAGDVYLSDATGTANVNGAFSPGILHLTATQPTLKAGLPYNGLALHGTRTGVSLAGATTFTGAATFSNGSRLVLNGKSLTIGGSLTLTDTSWVEMTNGADTLNVRGSLTIGTKDTRTNNLLTAGTLRVGGYFTAPTRFSFAPSGTHQTILDGTAFQYVSVDSAALDLGTWPNLTIRNPVRVAFGYTSTTSDSIALPNFQLDPAAGRVDFDYRRWGITPAGGTLTVTDTLYSLYGVVRIAGRLTLSSRTAAPVGSPGVAKAMLTGPGAFAVSGPLTTDAGSIVDIADLYLLDATGTANVDGAFSPATLHLMAAQPSLKPGLPYRSLTLDGARLGVSLTGATAVSGSASFSKGSRLVLNGHSLTVAGHLFLSDTSWVEMTNPNDTLNVRGNLNVGTKDTRAGNLLSAGTLRVGGYITAPARFSFAPTGSHQTILDGTSFQNVAVDSAALDLGTWPNVTIRNPTKVTFNYTATTSDSIGLPNFQIDPAAGRVDFNYRRWGVTPAGGTLTVTDTLYSLYGVVRVAGGLTLSSRAAAPVGSPGVAKAMLTGPGAFAVSGPLVTDAASAVDVTDLHLHDATGTANANGAFSPGVLHLTAAQPTLKPGLPYRGLDLVGTSTGVTLTGATTLTGSATFSSGSRLLLNGNTLAVAGNLTLGDASWVEMTNAADTLNVRGNLTVGTKDTRTGNLLSAGTLRIGGYVTAPNRWSFAPTQTHATILDGTSFQNVAVDSAALDLGTWPNVTIRNPTRVAFSYTATTSDSIGLPNFQIDPTAGRVDFNYRRWGVTPAGGTMTVTDTIYLTSATVRVAGAVTLSSRPAAPVGSPAVAKAMLTGSGGTLAIASALTTDAASIVDVNALELNDASGTGNIDAGGTFAPATLIFSGANQTMKPGLAYRALTLRGTSLTVPTGTTFSGNVQTYGDLTFAGTAVGTGYLEVHRGGKATAGSSTSFVDFTSIYNQEAAAGQFLASILDNTVGATGSGGFRYKSPGGNYYGTGGTLVGQTPGTHP
jgi:fibronectin-binding autotransporter adhesin